MRWSPTGVPDWNWNWTAVRPERYIFLNILVTVPQSPRHAALPPTGYYPLRTYYFASCTWLGIAVALRYLHHLPAHRCSVFFFFRSFASFLRFPARLPFISFVRSLSSRGASATSFPVRSTGFPLAGTDERGSRTGLRLWKRIRVSREGIVLIDA